MKTQTFGIEIELNNITREKAARTICDLCGESVRHTGSVYDTWKVKCADGREWKVVSDSSIAGPYEERSEIVSPICHWEDIPGVVAIAKALKSAGAVADPSCGIHIHIGANGHTAKTLRNLVNIISAKEDLLEHSFQISPARLNRWCQKVDASFSEKLNRERPKTMEEFARLWYDDQDWRYHAGQHYDPSRYHLLNLHSVFQKGTVEFRAFNSTLDPEAIESYIKICMAINAKALASKSARPDKPVTDNEAYAFRCWLLALGLIGAEFAITRKVLMANMKGNGAWRYGENTERRS